MIYTLQEIRSIVPSLQEKSDERVRLLLESAEVQICTMLRVRDLSKFTEMPMQVKTACVWIIEANEQAEKTAGMKSFKQGNISVDYADEVVRKNALQENLKNLLAPLRTVKVWS